jgi:hypothetical protein
VKSTIVVVLNRVRNPTYPDSANLFLTSRLGAGVGVHLSLATSEGNVDESTGVLEALESTALGDLGLLLLLNLRSLRLDLAGTGKRSVNFTHGE